MYKFSIFINFNNSFALCCWLVALSELTHIDVLVVVCNIFRVNPFVELAA